MTKFMLLQNYGATLACDLPMTEWDPADIKAHIEYQMALNDELAGNGELVDAQGLAGPELARFVTFNGVGAPVVTDGPFPESKELLAGYRMIDVESEVRALEIAAKASAAPGRASRTCCANRRRRSSACSSAGSGTSTPRRTPCRRRCSRRPCTGRPRGCRTTHVAG